MKEVTLKEAKIIEKELLKVKEKGMKKKGEVNSYRIFLPLIKKYGFEGKITLGTGKKAEVKSCDVEIKELNTRKYLKGKYLIIGVANLSGGLGRYYRGYVIKIKENEEV